MVENLQSEDNIPALMENMDLNKWILTTENGTINLKTEKLYESKREDMCTKMINVVYDPAASCPTWNKFLNEVLPNPDTQRYVKECLGSALTGDTSEENMFIMYGTGSNGKSVLMDTVSLLLGDFAVNIKASTLLTSDNTQHTHDNEIAMLRGARLVTASEPKKGMRLSDDVIKAITNSKAKITARRLYQEPFEFYPTHKTFFSSNHKPTVSDHSRGVWRRLRLIPFVTQVSHLKIKTHVR
jgi:putative DNA primase/helicase